MDKTESSHPESPGSILEVHSIFFTIFSLFLKKFLNFLGNWIRFSILGIRARERSAAPKMKSREGAPLFYRSLKNCFKEKLRNFQN